jgi:hypothetical protein
MRSNKRLLSLLLSAAIGSFLGTSPACVAAGVLCNSPTGLEFALNCGPSPLPAPG